MMFKIAEKPRNNKGVLELPIARRQTSKIIIDKCKTKTDKDYIKIRIS